MWLTTEGFGSRIDFTQRGLAEVNEPPVSNIYLFLYIFFTLVINRIALFLIVCWVFYQRLLQ